MHYAGHLKNGHGDHAYFDITDSLPGRNVDRMRALDIR